MGEKKKRVGKSGKKTYQRGDVPEIILGLSGSGVGRWGEIFYGVGGREFFFHGVGSVRI